MSNLVMMPAYVAEEHREMLADAEAAVQDWEQHLMAWLNSELNALHPTNRADPKYIRPLEQAFHDDPMRKVLIKNLVRIKGLVEKPRFLVKG